MNLRSFAEVSDMPEAWVDVAAIELRNGRTAEAREALARAARLGLQHAALGVAISALALELGDTAMAIEAGAAAVSRVPSLLADPWWSRDPGSAAIYSRILARSLELAGPDGRWEIELMADSPEAAYAAAASGSDPPLARDVISAWWGDEVAASRILARCNEEPLTGPIGWCARVTSRLDRTDESQRFQRLANMLRIPPDTVRELRIFAALTAESTAGDISTKAGGSWRNIVLWDVLVPGVVRVAPAMPTMAEVGLK
jgi:hypothetical protein